MRSAAFERALVWCHWLWFFVPHASVGYVAAAPARERFPERGGANVRGVRSRRGRLLGGADGTALVGLAEGHLSAQEGAVVRRMMLEYGQRFWGRRWDDLYGALGGNPLAAMPSLHFATSLMAARLLSEVGPAAGALGWAYTGALGLALVYLGEHYAIDLLAGVVLEETVAATAPRVAPAAHLLTRGLAALRARAAAD